MNSGVLTVQTGDVAFLDTYSISSALIKCDVTVARSGATFERLVFVARI